MNLKDLRASARSKADEQATGFITDPELDVFLNQGHRFVYGKIIQAFEDFFVVPGTAENGGLISVSGNQNSYSLPASFLKLVRAERRGVNETSENNWSKLGRLNIGNDDDNASFFPRRDGRELYGYFVAGKKIYLKPCPQEAFSLRLWFVPSATKLVNETDEPSVPEEYHDLIAEHGAMQILAKSGEGILPERKDAFTLELNNLIETITHRVQEPEQMIVTDATDYWGQC